MLCKHILSSRLKSFTHYAIFKHSFSSTNLSLDTNQFLLGRSTSTVWRLYHNLFELLFLHILFYRFSLCLTKTVVTEFDHSKPSRSFYTDVGSWRQRIILVQGNDIGIGPCSLRESRRSSISYVDRFALFFAIRFSISSAGTCLIPSVTNLKVMYVSSGVDSVGVAWSVRETGEVVGTRVENGHGDAIILYVNSRKVSCILFTGETSVFFFPPRRFVRV